LANRPNPLSIDVLQELDYSGFEKEFKNLTEQITKDDNARAEWIEECRRIRELIDGEDKRANKPWKHASDLSVPITKKLIRAWKPSMYNLVAMADPVCHFQTGIPDDTIQAPTAEEFFTWLTMTYMDGTKPEVQYLLDGVGGDRGMGYLNVSWDYRTELESRVAMAENLFPQGVPDDVNQVVQVLVQQYELTSLSQDLKQQLLDAANQLVQGAPYARLTYRRVIKDKPKITYFDPFRVIVPPNSGAPEDADYVCLVHDFSPSQLRQMAFDGILNAEAVEKLLEDSGDGDVGDKGQGRRYDHDGPDYVIRERQQDAGVQTDQQTKPIRVHQVYVLLDTNGDGIKERCVLWYSPIGNTRLALHDFPFSFRYWPIFRFDYEKVDRRPYISRGIGHLVKDLQEELNHQHRARQDATDIQLAPTFQMRMTSSTAPRNIRWGPGGVVPVNQIGDISPIVQNPVNLQHYLMSEGEVKSMAEELIGSVNSALQATGRNLERRTAHEVQAVAGQIEAIQGMDAASFQTTMRRVWQCVWEMWLDFGPNEIYYHVTGQQLPKPFRKSEHNNRYQLVPAGTPGNTNRQAELQRYLQLFQMFMQVPPGIINMEVIIQHIVRLMDPRMASAILVPMQQRPEQQQLMAAAAALAGGEVPDIMQATMAQGFAGGGPA